MIRYRIVSSILSNQKCGNHRPVKPGAQDSVPQDADNLIVFIGCLMRIKARRGKAA